MSSFTYVLGYPIVNYYYEVLKNRPLSQLSPQEYPKDIQQYNFWLAMPDSLKERINDSVSNFKLVVITDDDYYFDVLKLPTRLLKEALESGEIATFKVLNDKQILFTDIDGQKLLADAQYDPLTTEIIPIINDRS
jgi:hypothetical protein